MSDIDRNVAGFGAAMTQAETAAIDAGLRSYMRRVYNYMMVGLAITGAAALGLYLLSVTGTVADASYVIRAGRVIPIPAGFVVQGRDILLTAIGYAVFVSPLKWAIIFAPLALVFGLSFGVERLRPATAQLLFWLYAAMVGLSLASIFLIYTHTSITRVFFITAASFGALSLWGYTTQRDLAGLGSFAIMGVFGIIIASLVNGFLASSALQWGISVIGVLVFSGLTAWDTQRLKSEYLYGAMDGETAERSAILGALSLYLDFINLFTLLLQLLGQRDE
ncbi:MAG TPA: Bax inhibitor-1/YccA family protein [Xanthobacteraceae bacterium]|nr:Bax inhibitor-1/YccA family protein [Xanthobacteraceae bacterium]